MPTYNDYYTEDVSEELLSPPLASERSDSTQLRTMHCPDLNHPPTDPIFNGFTERNEKKDRASGRRA